MPDRRSALVTPVVIALSLTGCAQEPPTEPPLPAEPLELAGVWDFTEVLVLSRQIAVCRDTGSFRFTQDGEVFAGTGDLVGSCAGLAGEFRNRGPFVIESGEITENRIRFSMDNGCTYSGTVMDGAPRRMAGSSACPVNFDGSWEASEGSVVGGVRLEPDSLELVVGESFRVSAELSNLHGERIFERAVSWSTTDPAIVTVDDSGTVRSAAEGSVVVTASIEGLQAGAKITSEFVELAFVRAGVFHTCGVSVSGAAYCWGLGDAGQIGPTNGVQRCEDATCRPAPAAVSRELMFTDVSAGFGSSCGIGAGGAGYCWGSNAAGQLGDGSSAGSDTPVAVSGGVRFTSVSVGSDHACGISDDNVALCWGNNTSGQLGIGPPPQSDIPTAVSGGLRFVSLASGGIHTCGLRLDGTVHCWGDNFGGQLGVDVSTRRSFEPVAAVTGFAFSTLSAGGLHTCGITTDGDTYCWGENTDTQLGVDSVSFTPVPVQPTGGETFVAVSGGGFHTCALTGTGAAYCWGRGTSGQLGRGAAESSASPVAVAGGHVFVSVDAGAFHTCAMSAERRVYCWGSNETGELGAGTRGDVLTPIAVIGQP